MRLRTAMSLQIKGSSIIKNISIFDPFLAWVVFSLQKAVNFILEANFNDPYVDPNLS